MLQPDPVVAAIERQVAALGPVFDAQVLAATRAIYRPHLSHAAGFEEQSDVHYGPHARHRLDVYRPAGPSRAVVVFVHGGGFVAGDKNGDGVFYRNIGRWLARKGYTAVLPNYRLAPQDAWPAGTRDLQSVMQWVREDERSRSATQPVVLWGQSAGACHVASWLFDDAARGGERSAVDAIMLMSGFFVAESPLPAGPRAYFGDDVNAYVQRSPLTHASPLNIPIWLAVAELDPGWIAQQTYALARTLTIASGQSPSLYFAKGHNHVSTVQSLGSPQFDVALQILDFLDRVTA